MAECERKLELLEQKRDDLRIVYWNHQLDPVKLDFAFKTLTKHGDIGQDIRGILITDPGYVIVNIDLISS